MDPLVVALVLASAAIHPVWYALVKRDPDPDAAYLAVNGGIVVASFIHALFAGVDILAALAYWPLLALSLLGQIGYGLAVVAVLKRGDLSAYYPIIRSSPLAIVAIGFLFLGETFAPVLLLGIGLVLIGAIALQYRRGARLLAEPVNFALATGALVSSAVYAIVDGRLVQHMHPTLVLFWSQIGFLPLYAAIIRRTQPGWRLGFPLITWANAPWRYLPLGPMAYASYYLILTAYSLGANIAAVNSVRQVAIPLSVFIGGMWLAEGAMWRRLGAALVLAAGVVVIALSR